MNLPSIQGTCQIKDFFIYAACDNLYFSSFGPAFINSIQANTTHDIHIHIFNPAPEQLEFCQRKAVSVSWEHVPLHLFANSAARWSTVPTQEPMHSQYNRTINAMTKGKDNSLLERMQKTYFACARFIRLAELMSSQTVMAVDIDAVIKSQLPNLKEKDFYIHFISGKKARHLAGGIWLNPTVPTKDFINLYADHLQQSLEQDYIYWGLDQDVLDLIVPKFHRGQLPIEYIDWNMQPNSHIWTAKGTRKNLAVFIEAQKQYSV